MRGSRRFSQAIAEGDGISVIVDVADARAARLADEQGAEAIVVRRDLESVREATELPILWCAQGRLEDAAEAGADACLLDLSVLQGDDGALARLVSEAADVGLDWVLEVRDEEELERALELVDPEIFLLAPRDGEELEAILELLPDVPAGKLAIAEIAAATADDVAALERAGVDAVIVGARDVAELVGGAPPEV